ncbi:MAG: superoxide dismutase [Phycisphaerae bacterium]|nr:superoxide dismutase [Phycisphaerae bacterium]
MPFTLPQLPFDKAALAPHISAETLEFHYGKHHKAYVDKLNELLAGKPEASQTLEQVILSAEPGPVFNNAAQVWNHSFYWNGIKPGGRPIGGDLAAAVTRDLGSVEELKKQLQDACVTQFGSGWAWLVLEKGKLKVTKTGNADLPMKHGQTALLTIDVWEHAYYIDYRNARPKYVAAVIENLVNWDVVAKNLKDALVAVAR